MIDAGASARSTPAASGFAERARAYVRAHEWTIDAALIIALTAVAGALRLVKLGDIPYGVHSDEAQVGTDAHRILSDGWIGVYTHAALGQPTGHAYLTTPSIWGLGDTAFALRLPLALVALAAVPLLYLLVRVSFRRTEAVFAAGMLAVSYWHLYYSRLAHWSISYGTVLVAALLCLMLGMRRGGWWWYAASGALLGIGVYTYNIDPIAIVAAGAFIAIMSVRVLLARRGEPLPQPLPPQAVGTAVERADAGSDTLPRRRAWFRGVAVLALAAVTVALPFLNYVRNPDAYYWAHFNNYEDVRITRTPQYAAAGTWERIGLIAGQAKYFASAYARAERPDTVDGNGSVRPVFDPLTLVLIAAGLLLAWRYRREPMVIAALCGLVILPLPAVLQKGSIMREPVGAAPYAMFFAALPLAALWRSGWQQRNALARYAPPVAACAAVALIAGVTVHDYFWTMRKDPFVRTIFFSQETSASTYMRTLPADTYVYFYSDRAPLSLETRQFLAPDVRGEDRSAEFGGAESIPDNARRPSVFILMGRYEPLLGQIEAQYPGGEEQVVERDGKFEFAAYRLANDD
jgi:hypothetical protein